MTDEPQITARQLAMMRAIADGIRERGYAPSVRELCEALAIRSTSAVIAHLWRLERKGLLVREIATWRAVRLTAAGTTKLGGHQ